MSHKAFAFNWISFDVQLRSKLVRALAINDAAELESFLDQHRLSLTDPYEGDPLPENWRTRLENHDVQEYADFALTRFYNPTDDFGIGSAWLEWSQQLPASAANALLGFPIGTSGRLFDPGRCGSYFQTPPQALESLRTLRPIAVPTLQPFIELLERCDLGGSGVYVTF